MRPPFVLPKDRLAKAKHLLTKEEGANLVEYGLLLGFVAVVVVGAVNLLGLKVLSQFQSLGAAL